MEVDNKAKVLEKVEIEWEDGQADEIDRNQFAQLAMEYPAAFQYPLFTYNPARGYYETYKDFRLPTIRLV